MGRNFLPAFALIVLGSVSCAASARADDPPPNKLTGEEIAQGRVLLFDGETVSEWEIDGDHELVDGTLILGRNQTTRACLKAHVRRGFEMRFQYRTEGKESAGVGWDTRAQSGKLIPGVSLPILTPKEDWYDSFLLDYADFPHFFQQQRFIKHQHGANGVWAPIESLWIEVPAGNKLFLRNIRLREGETAPWQRLLVIPFIVAAFTILFVWRWKKKQPSEANSNNAATAQ